ncbi:hypothetical protein [Paenibacillus sp. SI8]
MVESSKTKNNNSEAAEACIIDYDTKKDPGHSDNDLSNAIPNEEEYIDEP